FRWPVRPRRTGARAPGASGSRYNPRNLLEELAMKRRLLGLGLVVVLGLVCVAAYRQAAAPGLQDAIRQVDTLAAGEYAKDPVGGLTVGIVAGPALVWTKSYGYAGMENKQPASADTAYRIGSITKQFTALMLLQLVEKGTLHLTDVVEKHLPEIKQVPKFRSDAPAITFLQLATMTSGLAREPGCDHHSEGPVSQW